MLTYILRRLLIMIPTLFGVTVVSFFIMQLAPGDPLLAQLGGGAAGQSTGTREAYLIQKRDLHLDKPLLLNFRYFKDYSTAIHWAAYYRARTVAEIQSELPELAKNPDEPQNAEKLAYLRSLGIPEFEDRLKDPERWELLAKSIDYFTLVFCEDRGQNAVPAAIAILRDSKSDLKLKIGAIRCLNAMVVDPFVFTYSIHPSETETPAVTGAWRLWWERRKASLPQVDAEARKYLEAKLKEMAAARDKVDPGLEEIVNGDYADVAPRFFAEKLLDEATPLEEKFVASVYLKRVFAEPLRLDVPTDAAAADVNEAAADWLEYYQIHQAEYEPTAFAKLWYIVSDTQYGHMIVRLVTFDFGRSALRTREPVSGLIWQAFLVSAPLIFISELLIYIVAVPLGILCGVFRNGWTDRSISLGLFLLYSIPGFVAGMLFLVFFCYGDYFKWFPMLGLHSDEAQNLPFLAYLGDYLWHAFMPVVCLSLFSLAAIAMYSRSSILDVINQDYIRTARAKGLPEHKVILKHALRNGLIPILTLFSSFLPAMLGGAVLIEYLFDIPGLGRLGWSSILQKDFPTQMALLYVEAIVTLVSFLITDILYVLVDPPNQLRGAGEGGMSVDPDVVVAAAPVSDTPIALSLHDGDAYLDIVWRQFKKNRPAYFSLWLMVGLFLIAIFAPLLASNVPLVFHEGNKTIYPWFQWLFHPEEPVDFFFNMALVGFVPWGVLALFTSYWSKSQGIPGRRRLGLVALEFLAILLSLIVVFSIPGVGPENSFASRDFPEEQFKSHGANYGVYALVPFGPTEQDTPSRFQPPGFRVDDREMTKSNQAYTHLLGTVDTGQDVLARMVYGTRISMTVGLVTVSIYIVIGVIVGSLAGYFGGIIDMVISRIIEIVLLFPAFFLILTIVALVGQGIFVIMAVLGGTGWTGVARLVRGEVLKQRSLDYTLAAQALGASHTRILFRHILKNSLSPVLVSIPFGIAGAIITEAGLSLLGFGVRPPAPSWGGLLNIAHDNYHNWWLVVVPSVAIFITVTTFNLIGTGLRDAMDPRLRI